MKSNLKLASDVPPRSPGRERLAEAIERHDTATNRIESLHAAHTRLSAALFGENGAIRAAEKAEEAVKAAKADEGRYLAAIAVAEAPADANPINIAERALADAQAQLDTTRKTVVAVNEEIKVAEKALAGAEDGLNKAVREVVKAETGASVLDLLRQAEALQSDLINQRVVLRHLLHSDSVDEPQQPAVKSFLRNTTLPGTYGDVEFQDWNRHPACDPWVAARAALRENPDAPLPA